MGERLGVRVQRSRPVARDAVELGRAGLVAAEREVMRDHGRVRSRWPRAPSAAAARRWSSRRRASVMPS